MEEREIFIGFMAPRCIADALRKRKEETGISAKHQIIKALKKHFKIKEECKNGTLNEKV